MQRHQCNGSALWADRGGQVREFFGRRLHFRRKALASFGECIGMLLRSAANQRRKLRSEPLAVPNQKIGALGHRLRLVLCSLNACLGLFPNRVAAYAGQFVHLPLRNSGFRKP